MSRGGQCAFKSTMICLRKGLVEFILGTWKQLMVHLLWIFDHILCPLGCGLVGLPLLSRLKCFDNYLRDCH